MAHVYSSPDNPIYEHFSRQRTDWWRVHWWLPALAGLMMLIPAANAVLTTFFQAAYHTYLPPQVYVFGILSGRLFIPAAMFLTVMALLSAASYHRLPPELILTGGAEDTNRLFQRSLRRDAYLLFGAIYTLPLLVIIGLDCLFPPSFRLVGEFPGLAFGWSAVYLAGTAGLLAEIAILFQLRLRWLPQLAHLLAPLALIGVFCLIGPSPEEINVPLLPFADQILRMPEPAAAIAWGICLGLLAVVVYRVNAKLPIREDHWREG